MFNTKSFAPPLGWTYGSLLLLACLDRDIVPSAKIKITLLIHQFSELAELGIQLFIAMLVAKGPPVRPCEVFVLQPITVRNLQHAR